MKNKKLIFWAALVIINLCLALIIVSVYYYRTNSSSNGITERLEKAEKAGGPEGVGIWRTDDKLGYSHIANSSGVHKTENFKVRYTIGPSGERYIPAPEAPAGRILFLGGSLTFGHGVEDLETFPAVLAKEYWSDFEIVNRAVMGWGTSHAYLTLLESLESASAPDMVIYGYIPDHAVRNYIRRDWLVVMDRYKRRHPHFELMDGKLRFQGVVGMAEGLKNSRELGEKEIELTAALLAAMQEACRAKKIPFVVLLLPKLQPFKAEVIEALKVNRISTLDISNERPEGFKSDPHPNANDHRRIAEAILNSFIGSGLERGQGE
ncbi:MAG: SGNH/GDSL hydrolase family protein [Thermodesulfobacteriota bacterium]